MNTAAEFPVYRSEAFAEDVVDLVARAPVVEPLGGSARWLANALPVAVALLGVAFAVVPPLT
jgi:hypothetical protein